MFATWVGRMATWGTVDKGLQMSLKQDVHSLREYLLMDCRETKTSSIFCGANSDDNFHNTLSNDVSALRVQRCGAGPIASTSSQGALT